MHSDTLIFRLFDISDLFPLALIHQYQPMMSELTVELTAPNGLQIEQPIGLFINNEFVKSASHEKFATINPT